MMKNLKIFFAALLVALVFSCQDGKAQKSAEIFPGTWGTLWGTAADTLIQSDTLDITMRIRGNNPLDLRYQLYVTKVSGTVTSNFILQGAMVDLEAAYEDIDTIALSNVSTGFATSINVDDFNYPYARLRSITTATAQKASYLLYYISRSE